MINSDSSSRGSRTEASEGEAERLVDFSWTLAFLPHLSTTNVDSLQDNMSIKFDSQHLHKDHPASINSPSDPGFSIFPVPPNSLVLAEYSYALLRLDSSIERIFGDLNSPLIVMRCKQSKRTAVIHRCIGHNVLGRLVDIQDHLRVGHDRVDVEVVTIPEYTPTKTRPAPRLPHDFTALQGLDDVLKRLGQRHGVTYTIRDTPRSEATMFCVERSTSALTLYHPTVDVPGCHIADLDGFHRFYGVFETLNVAANAIDDKLNEATCQYDGTTRAARLPALTDRAKSIIEECRAVDWSDRISIILSMKDESLAEGQVVQPINILKLMEALELVINLAPVCLICAKDNDLTKCGGCKAVYYCRKEHQRLDWPLHKSW